MLGTASVGEPACRDSDCISEGTGDVEPSPSAFSCFVGHDGLMSDSCLRSKRADAEPCCCPRSAEPLGKAVGNLGGAVG